MKEGGGEEGQRVRAREGACTGAATMPQPSTSRLIRIAAALAAASPSLLFSDWKNPPRLKRKESDWLRCDGTQVEVKCASVSPIAIHLALRSNVQRRVDVLRVCQEPILQGVAATPITVMGDAEVKDQAPAASLVPYRNVTCHSRISPSRGTTL